MTVHDRVRAVGGLRLGRIAFDGPRLAFLVGSLGTLTLVARALGIDGVPAVHLETVVVAPFLLTRVGATLAVFSLLVATARIAQGLFGFDQVFVAANLLLRNFSDFPVLYSVAIAGAFIGYLALIVFAMRHLPVRMFSVSPWVAAALVAGLGAAKIAEDFARQNLVGSSYGYFVGQLRFADMFNAAYRTPGARPLEYPGPAGAQTAIAHRSSYLLVVVESLGQPLDDELAKELMLPFRSEALRRKYEVSLGSVPSPGSTIHGEIRQLCDGDLKDGLFGVANSHCVPARLAREGYRTRAVHANGSTVYGRNVWYPKIGFGTIAASDTEAFLRGERSRRWGTVLDGDTISWAARTLHEEPGPAFTYLLTVSTHLPASLLPGAQPSASCPSRASEHACVHLANLQVVLRSIADSALGLDNTVIVVAGDHPPPFVSSNSRRAFSRTDVPWLMLVPHAP